MKYFYIVLQKLLITVLSRWCAAARLLVCSFNEQPLMHLLYLSVMVLFCIYLLLIMCSVQLMLYLMH